MNLHIPWTDIEFYLIFFFLGISILALCILWSYLKYHQWISLFLISIILVSLFIIVFDLRIRKQIESIDPPNSVQFHFLFDNSSSMLKKNIAGASKVDLLQNYLQIVEKKRNANPQFPEISYYSFGSKLDPLENTKSLSFTQNQSDINDALNKLSEIINLSSHQEHWVFLFTDGEFTRSMMDTDDILMNLLNNQIRVFPFPPISKYLPSLVLNLGNLITPDQVLVNQPFNIQFQTRTRLMASEEITVLITKEDEKYEVFKTDLSHNGNHIHQRSITLDKPGFHKFTIHILPQDSRLPKQKASFIINAQESIISDHSEWLQMNQKIFSPGDAVMLTSNLRSDNTEIRVKLPGRNHYTQLPEFRENRLFFPLLNSGEYEFALFKDEKRLIRQIANAIPYSLEEEYSGLNLLSLSQLADDTRGQVIQNEQQLLELLERFDGIEMNTYTYSSIQLGRSPILFSILSLSFILLWLLKHPYFNNKL